MRLRLRSVEIAAPEIVDEDEVCETCNKAPARIVAVFQDVEGDLKVGRSFCLQHLPEDVRHHVNTLCEGVRSPTDVYWELP